MAYKTTYKRDVFTPEEIKEWGVKPFQRWKTHRRGKHGSTIADGWVNVHSMWVYYPAPNVTAYKYHQTEIVRYNEATTELTLDTEEWTTPVTREHINEILTKDLELPQAPSVSFTKAGDRLYWHCFTLDYIDGMTIPLGKPHEYLQHLLPYGSFTWDSRRLKYHLDDFSCDWYELITKIGKLPEKPDTLKLKVKYGLFGDVETSES